MDKSEHLGTEEIGKLMIGKAVPISVGVLVFSLYYLADTIFVGHFVGTLGISAVTVVFPVVMLIISIGKAIGIGGSSLITLLLGERKVDKANAVFGNMLALNALITFSIVAVGVFFEEQMLFFFGAKGDILPAAQVYFRIILPGVPFIAFDIMVNNVMNAQGRSRAAMQNIVIPAVINIILDAVFIIGFDWGIAGAAWATTIAYITNAAYSIWFFFFRHSEIKLVWSRIKLKYATLKAFIPLCMVPFARNVSSNMLIVVLNHVLFFHGNEAAVAMYGILNRFQLFIIFPLAGIVQSFAAIAGFNYGAGNWERVKQSIRKSIRFGTLVTVGLFIVVMLFPGYLIYIFTTVPELVKHTPAAMRLFFLALPVLAVQQIGTIYFRSIGNSGTALFLTLLFNFLVIPLVLILPLFLGLNGVWLAFAIANTVASGIVYWKLRQDISQNLEPKIQLAKV